MMLIDFQHSSDYTKAPEDGRKPWRTASSQLALKFGEIQGMGQEEDSWLITNLLIWYSNS